MHPVDIFVAAYLVGIMVILGVLSILAYKRQVRDGIIKDEEKK